AGVNAAVQGGAVVGENVWGVDVEVAAPEGLVAEPAFGLLRQSIDEDEGLATGVAVRLERVYPISPVSHHGLYSFGQNVRPGFGALPGLFMKLGSGGEGQAQSSDPEPGPKAGARFLTRPFAKYLTPARAGKRQMLSARMGITDATGNRQKKMAPVA